MKKSCFLTLISLLTVIITIIIYIFKFHSDDVFNLVKPLLLGKSEKAVYTKIDGLKVKTNTDSLKKLIVAYENNLKTAHKINLHNVDLFFRKVNQALDDGKIDSTEISEITHIIQNRDYIE